MVPLCLSLHIVIVSWGNLDTNLTTGAKQMFRQSGGGVGGARVCIYMCVVVVSVVKCSGLQP